MNLFFDTSALVKHFHEEDGSEIVTELINSQENKIWILEIAKIEFFCSLYRRYRNHELTDLQFDEAIRGFEKEIAFYNIELLRQPIIKETENLIKQYGKVEGLRTLDALHLGAFSLISEKDWIFVAADKNLCNVAKIMGYSTINPLDKLDEKNTESSKKEVS